MRSPGSRNAGTVMTANRETAMMGIADNILLAETMSDVSSIKLKDLWKPEISSVTDI